MILAVMNAILAIVQRSLKKIEDFLRLLYAIAKIALMVIALRPVST